ncbi:MAG: ParA family protein, partial [Oscillospiraceae bacterium]
MIGIANTKGGVGKTTTTLNLATLFARNGYDVEIIDADMQGSLTEWVERIEEKEKLPFNFSIGNKRTISKIKNLKNSGKVIIIDTPPHDADVVQQVIDVSDFIIVPTSPSAMDLDRVWETVSTIDGMYGVLLTMTQARTKTHRLAKEILEEEKISYFKHHVRQLEQIKSLFGTLPDEKSLSDYQNVFNELLEQIN